MLGKTPGRILAATLVLSAPNLARAGDAPTDGKTPLAPISQTVSDGTQKALATQDAAPEVHKKLSVEQVKKGIGIISINGLESAEVTATLQRFEAASSREIVRQALVDFLTHGILLNRASLYLYQSDYLNQADREVIQAAQMKKIAADVTDNKFNLSWAGVATAIVGTKAAPIIEGEVQKLLDKKEYDSVISDARSYGKGVSPVKMKAILSQAIAGVEASDTDVQQLAQYLDEYEGFFTQDEMKEIVSRFMPRLYPHVFVVAMPKLARYAAFEKMAEKTESMFSTQGGGGLDRSMLIGYAANFRPYISDADLGKILQAKGGISLDHLNLESALKAEERKEGDDNEEKRHTEYMKGVHAELDALFQ